MAGLARTLSKIPTPTSRCHQPINILGGENTVKRPWEWADTISYLTLVVG